MCAVCWFACVLLSFVLGFFLTPRVRDWRARRRSRKYAEKWFEKHNYEQRPPRLG